MGERSAVGSRSAAVIAVGVLIVAAVVIAVLLIGGRGRTTFPSMGPQDDAFVAAMVPHHELGLELIDDANMNADDVRLRHLAFEMQGYHSSELHELHDRLNARHLTPADDFPGRIDRSRIDALASSAGATHDVAWLRVMIEHHEGAVASARAEIAGGDDPSLVDVARRVEEVQSAEITRMRSLVDEICADAPETNGCGSRG